MGWKDESPESEADPHPSPDQVSEFSPLTLNLLQCLQSGELNQRSVTIISPWVNKTNKVVNDRLVQTQYITEFLSAMLQDAPEARRSLEREDVPSSKQSNPGAAVELGQGTQMHVTEVIIFLGMLTYCSWLEHELNKEHACHSLSKGLQ